MAVQKSIKLPPDRHDAFAILHEQQLLGAHETVSGTGSTLMATALVRRGLEALWRGGLFASVLDVGCGDFNWICLLVEQGLAYTGIDIVPALIDANRKQYPGVAFEVMDIVAATPPAHDLVICRDLFTHFPLADITTALGHIRRSGARYLAATSNRAALGKAKMRELTQNTLNSESSAGYWRPVDLSAPPFDFPPPLLSIPENQPGKTLDIWPL